MDYDDLLHDAHRAYRAAMAHYAREIEDARLRTEAAETGRADAEAVYTAAVRDLADRRLAGEFQRTGGKKRTRTPGDRDAMVRRTLSRLENPDDFVGKELVPLLEADGYLVKRSTLSDALGRLVRDGSLRILEHGLRRRPTRYACMIMGGRP